MNARRNWLRCVALAALVGACATPPLAPAPAPVLPAPEAVVAPAPLSEAPRAEVIKSQPLKHLIGRKLKPIPDKALGIRTRCTFRDVAGGRGKLDLHVTKAEVKRFVAEVDIPKHGLCRFDLTNFRQSATLPIVVLDATASACVVRMWEQDKGVTVAFNGCQSHCAGDAFSYLWPILVNTRNGRCS